jgi:hypothetical protein
MANDTIPPGFLHACPYSGVLEAYNVSLTKIPPEMRVFLFGRYRLALTLFDEEDENIFTAFVDLELTADMLRGKPSKKNQVIIAKP